MDTWTIIGVQYIKYSWYYSYCSTYKKEHMMFTKLAMRKLHQNSFSTKLFSRSFLRPCKSIIPTTTMFTNTKNKVIIDHSHHILYIILLFGLLLISIFLTSTSNTPSFFSLQLSLFNPSKQVKTKPLHPTWSILCSSLACFSCIHRLYLFWIFHY